MVPHTRRSLARDLKYLGIEPGDILFVHSSYKSLGPVQGGAEIVIGALDDSIGGEGLLLMPSFNLVEREDRARTWNLETTPSTVGWITECFRLGPGTFRSDHYSHSVAARGRGAREFVAEHLCQEGLDSPWDREPWGKTYGLHSPMVRAYQADAKLLMLGVDYRSSTYVHLVEVMYWHRLRARDQAAPYPALKRPELGAYWDQVGEPQRGPVGDAACRLFSIRAYVDGLLDEVGRHGHLYLS